MSNMENERFVVPNRIPKGLNLIKSRLHRFSAEFGNVLMTAARQRQKVELPDLETWQNNDLYLRHPQLTHHAVEDMYPAAVIPEKTTLRILYTLIDRHITLGRVVDMDDIHFATGYADATILNEIGWLRDRIQSFDWKIRKERGGGYYPELRDN